MGAHVRTGVHGPIMNSSNVFTQRAEALEGLRPIGLNSSFIHPESL
jgi:hypothetical protein